jgi:hypothetical protein
MKFYDLDLHTKRILLELKEGVPFEGSPVGFHLNETASSSPSLQDDGVKFFLESFRQFGEGIGVEVDKPKKVLTELPGIFFFPIFGGSLKDFVAEINKHLDTPFEVSREVRALGFFPSRSGKIVREITPQGEVFQDGVKIAQEFVGNPPSWATNLILEGQAYSNIRYNHHKISVEGERKVYGYASSFSI